MEIFADEIQGALRIITSGGNGLRGQNGGNGQPGEDNNNRVNIAERLLRGSYVCGLIF